MNAVNTLFVLSCIFVPLLLISINYSSINDFYSYSVPLNSLELSNDFRDTPYQFEKIKSLPNSTCFITPSMNEFCYPKPVIRDSTIVAQLVGNNVEFDGGEMHFVNVDGGEHYFSMKNMEQIDGDSILLTFGDRDGKVTGSFFTSSENFEFSTIVNKFDTFVDHCNKEDGTNVLVVQYLGVQTIDENDYFITWHISADLEKPIICDYPEIIKHSLDYDFGI